MTIESKIIEAHIRFRLNYNKEANKIYLGEEEWKELKKVFAGKAGYIPQDFELTEYMQKSIFIVKSKNHLNVTI